MNEEPMSQDQVIRELAARSNLWVEVRQDVEWGGIEVGGGDPGDNELCGLMSQLRNVTALDILPGTGIADDGFGILCAAFRDLRRLKFSSSRVTQSGFRNVKDLRELRDVDVRVCFPGDIALDSLGKLPRLRRIRIVNSGVTGEGLRSLRNCAELEVVDVTKNGVADGFDAFVGCMCLKELIVELCPLSLNGVRQIAQLRSLRKLIVSRSPLDDEMMMCLGELGKLRVLYANGCPITARSLVTLGKFVELEELIWPTSAIDERKFRVFEKLRAIRELRFWGEEPMNMEILESVRTMLPGAKVENIHLGEGEE